MGLFTAASHVFAGGHLWAIGGNDEDVNMRLPGKDVSADVNANLSIAWGKLYMTILRVGAQCKSIGEPAALPESLTAEEPLSFPALSVLVPTDKPRSAPSNYEVRRLSTPDNSEGPPVVFNTQS